MKRKLFVLSVDAMVHEDIKYLSEKPNFKKIMNDRAEAAELLSVYPASTYPAHTSIITGCNPGKHGIYSNLPLRTVSDGITHWYLYSKSIWQEDIFAAAKRAGRTTAAVYWPITGKNPNVDHIINEYFFFYPDDKDHIEENFEKMGADSEALKAVRENLDRFPPKDKPAGINLRSTYDNFIMGCTCSLIRNCQPDVLFVHHCYIDSTRHRFGVFGEEVNNALDTVDMWLGETIDAMQEAGVYDDTDFIILSDHGQMNYTRHVRINVLLKHGGFIDLAPDGKTIYDWQAYAQTNGMSTTVHLSDNTNKKLYDRVYAYLLELAENMDYGIEKVYTKDELLEKYGQSGPYSFMLETDGRTIFTGDLAGDPINEPGDGIKRATHGYAPEKGPKPVFLAHGPSFKNGAYLPSARLIDIAPTLAHIMEQQMEAADGRVLSELLDNK